MMGVSKVGRVRTNIPCPHSCTEPDVVGFHGAGSECNMGGGETR